MHPRLPESSQGRYRRKSRHVPDLIGVLLVVVAGFGSAAWISQTVYVNTAGLVTLPASFGFMMWSGRPARNHAGSAAPLIGTMISGSTCDPEHATFVLGLADLKVLVGSEMGDPVECERRVDAEGNTVQLTTTGRAEYLHATDTSAFTDGARQWALTNGTLTVSQTQPT
jgi:hypothetical protein